VLTDDEIAGLSSLERRELISRLARPTEEIMPVLRKVSRLRGLRLALATLLGLSMIPWIFFLSSTLPHSYVAANWDATWIGFDVLVLVMLLTTVVLGLLRRQMLVLTAFATGVLFVCDAWFDVMTSHGDDRRWALVAALLIELPAAVLLCRGAIQALRVAAVTRHEAGPRAHVWELKLPTFER
jgi:hypothetical protein